LESIALELGNSSSSSSSSLKSFSKAISTFASGALSVDDAWPGSWLVSTCAEASTGASGSCSSASRDEPCRELSGETECGIAMVVSGNQSSQSCQKLGRDGRRVWTTRRTFNPLPPIPALGDAIYLSLLVGMENWKFKQTLRGNVQRDNALTLMYICSAGQLYFQPAVKNALNHFRPESSHPTVDPFSFLFFHVATCSIPYECRCKLSLVYH